MFWLCGTLFRDFWRFSDPKFIVYVWNIAFWGQRRRLQVKLTQKHLKQGVNMCHILCFLIVVAARLQFLNSTVSVSQSKAYAKKPIRNAFRYL
jgi:hypothetical protein